MGDASRLYHLELAIFLNQANGLAYYAEFWATRHAVSVAWGQFRAWRALERTQDASGLTVWHRPRKRGVWLPLTSLAADVATKADRIVMVHCGDDNRLTRAFWLMLRDGGWKRYHWVVGQFQNDPR